MSGPWLNYQHLYYFWSVAREGGVSLAAKKLRLAQPTVSGQVHALENSLGTKLLERSGRKLVLTDAGRTAMRYADVIFGQGRDLVEALAGRGQAPPLFLTVGVVEALSKIVAYRVLSPVLEVEDSVRLSCREDKPERLLGDLASGEVDVVIADAPAPPGSRVHVYSHALGDSGVTFFAAAKLAKRLRRGFPKSLDGCAMLLPAEAAACRRPLDRWFESIGVRPRIVAEFEDSALMKMFGAGGAGVFVGPTAFARDIAKRYEVLSVGATDEVRERVFAISLERRLKHPAVLAITRAAKAALAHD
jgi:LysR family transcriptional activator of nhaA